MLRSTFTIAIIIAGAIVMLAALQRQLIYFPTTATEERLLEIASRAGMQAWRDDEGGIIGWRSANDQRGNKRLVVFQGNAGFALDRVYFRDGFEGLGEGWDVLLFEYPGYGARGGKPSAEVIRQAAAQALGSLTRNDDRPIYLLGESLGSGVATYLAGSYPDTVAGLLLITAFTSLADVAAKHYPFLPVRILLSENYDSSAALADYRGPVAFLLAGRDEIVPLESGQALHDGYTGPRWLRIEPDAGHNSLPYHPRAQWWKQVSDFLTGVH